CSNALFGQPPDPGGHFDAGLISLRGLGGRGAFDLHPVAFLDAAHLGVHHAGNAVFARQDAQVRAHRPAGADYALELFQDRRGQRAAAIVDDRHRIGRYARVEQFQHAVARTYVAGDADQILGVFDVIVADPALLAPVLVGRRDHRLGMLEREGLRVFADPRRRLIDLGAFPDRDYRRIVESMTGRYQLCLDGGEILRGNQIVGLVEHEACPIPADGVEFAADQV